MNFYMLVTDVNIHYHIFSKTEAAAFYGHKVYFIILNLSTSMTVNYVYLKCVDAVHLYVFYVIKFHLIYILNIFVNKSLMSHSLFLKLSSPINIVFSF